MKKYKVPDDVKEITINKDGLLVYLKKDLIEIAPGEWNVVGNYVQLEEIKEKNA